MPTSTTRSREDARMDNETLTITDNRTKATYTIPIYRGTVLAGPPPGRLLEVDGIPERP